MTNLPSPRTSKKLCAGLGDPSTADMNIARFDGRLGLDYEALNTAVNAAPFLAPRRVMVLVHPVAAFSTPEARKKFIDLLDRPSPPPPLSWWSTKNSSVTTGC